MNEITEEFLAAPLDAHPDGVRGGVENAAAAITARVESWSEEVTAS